MSAQANQPDIRVPDGPARPLTKSEKCSIAGRKGGQATYMKYGPKYMSSIGSRGFDAAMRAAGMDPTVPANRAAFSNGFVKGGKWTPRKR